MFGAVSATGNTSDSWNDWVVILEEVRLELGYQIEEKMEIHVPIMGEKLLGGVQEHVGSIVRELG